MNCDEVLSLLDPLVDRELPINEEAAVKMHIDRCLSCQRELQQLNELRKRLQQVPRYTVPASLEGDVVERLANASGTSTAAPFWNRWIKPVVTHVAAALAGGVIFYGAVMPRNEPMTPAREIVAAHVRSLMDENITQVTTGNPHTVGPWFAGKIDYAPAVHDLKARGFPLVGGRIDYLQDRNVAALVYLRREHRINLFVMPSRGKPMADTVQLSRNGYNIVGWRHKSFTYWAVSDLTLEELIAFSNLVIGK